MSNSFEFLAKETLKNFEENLIALDPKGLLDVEFQDSVLTVETANKKQFILNIHRPMQQLWLSSPVSGAYHFSYDEAKNEWVASNGKILSEILEPEVKTFL